MAAVFSTILRGAVGVAATVLIVAIAWSLYLNRDSVMEAVAPVTEMVAPGPAASPQQEQTSTATTGTGAAPSDAPAPGAPEQEPTAGQQR